MFLVPVIEELRIIITFGQMISLEYLVCYEISEMY